MENLKNHADSPDSLNNNTVSVDVNKNVLEDRTLVRVARQTFQKVR